MSDSVGKIGLDLELQGDLGKQINEAAAKIGEQLKASLQNIGNINFKALADNISKSIKGSIDESMKTVKSSIEKTLNSALAGVTATSKKIKIPVDFNKPSSSPALKESAVSSIKAPRGPPIPKISTNVNFDAIKAQIENLTQSIDITNARIEQQQEKLAQLKESYRNAFDGTRKNKLKEQILKTEATINKLTATSDKSGFKLADLDKQFEVLSLSAKETTAGVAAVTNELNKTGGASSKLNNHFGRLGKATKDSGNNFRGMNYSLSMIMRQFFTSMIVLPLVMRGLTAFTTFLGQSLMANTQFANSLAQIRSNLYTAFMPIYQAALPAINALMSGLSKITAYIASFTSALFGKTYKQSFQAAKGLIAAKTAMGVYGEAAKKAGKDAKGALAGFDEINTLNMGKKDDAGAGRTGSDKVSQMVMPSVDTSAIDKSMGGLAQRFKSVLGTIFQPFKTGWKTYGSSIVANIDGTVSNIISVFKGIGTTIGDVWGARGQGIVNTFGILLSGVSANLKSMSSLLKGIWDNGGQYLFQKILEFGASIIEFAGKIYEQFIMPMNTWFADNLNPIIEAAVGGILKVIGDLFAKFTEFIDWLGSDAGKGVLDNIVIVLGSMAAAFGIVKGAIAAWNIIQAIYAIVTNASAIATWALDGAISFLTSPITIAVLAIGTLIAIGILLYKNWDSVSAFLINIWNGIKAAASSIFNAVVSTIKYIFNGIGTWFSNVFTDAWNGIKRAFSSVGSFFSGVWSTIKSMFTNIGSTIGNAVGDAFKYVVNSIIGFAENTINKFIRAINGAIGLINAIPGVNIRTLSTISIPKLARGGIIDQPTLAMVGERGKEAVMPLENNTGWIDNLAAKIATILAALQPQSNSNNSDRPLEIILQFGDTEFVRFIVDSINKLSRQEGKSVIKV